jgi:hypothetical protein
MYIVNFNVMLPLLMMLIELEIILLYMATPKVMMLFYIIDLFNYLLSLNMVIHNIDSGQFSYCPFGYYHLNFIILL